MSNQKSFSFLYKLKKNTNSNINFDVHINVWNISDKKSKPFIDFGLRITNFEDVDSVCFTAPFKVMDDDVIDLSHLLKEDEIQLIFNNSDYKYKQIGSIYGGYEYDNEKSIVFLPIKKSKNNQADNTNLEYVSTSNKNDDTFEMKINLSKCSDIHTKTSGIYIRFRIRNIDNSQLLGTLASKNNYLESAFTERQILDFKLNNVRTLDKYNLSSSESEGYMLMKFNSIHFFLMVPSDFEITTWGNFSDCRQLEKNEWKDYLGKDIPDSTLDISAYHWKQKSENQNKKVEEFAQLTKMEHKATNIKLIFIYCLIVVILGALGSTAFEMITNLIKCIF